MSFCNGKYSTICEVMGECPDCKKSTLMKSAILTESKEQQALIKWAHTYRMPNGKKCSEYLIKITNEGKRSVANGARMKREGLKKGVSDLFLAYPFIGYPHLSHGLWIELKNKKGKESVDQRKWAETMKEVGYTTLLAFGWEAAKDGILEYIQQIKEAQKNISVTLF